ncbi:MAG TPA: sugar transferase [Chroococcidiopsis sp.]
MDFHVTSLNQVCLVQMPTLFTVTEAIAFKQTCQALCQAEPLPKRIILDFGKTGFIDSSGIGALVTCQKTFKARGIEMIFWSLSPQVEMVLSLTGLNQLFVVDPQTRAIVPTDSGSSSDRSIPIHPSVRSKVKRLIDIVGALVGLGITGVLLVPIAIAIQIDNPGPLFFSQTRCGWLGKQFRLWKFRSMVTNASELKHLVENQVSGPIFKNADDPRITRVGKFLRRTSLDELPQFWNVLRGEMSLVGTRPPTLDEVDFYEVPEWQRLDVKPGMTGEWQVHGRSQVTTFEEVIRLDLRYQRNWTLKHDLKLIFKTIWVVFNKDSGAY